MLKIIKNVKKWYINLKDKINFFQMIFTGIAAIAAVLATFYARDIGIKQNEINETALKMSDFVDVYVSPQQQIFEEKEGGKETVTWNILIKNASSRLVYLTSVALNGVKVDGVDSNAIPNNPDSSYSIPISPDIQNEKKFSLTIEFEDYLGRKYCTNGSGYFDDISWRINTKKRIEIR